MDFRHNKDIYCKTNDVPSQSLSLAFTRCQWQHKSQRFPTFHNIIFKSWILYLKFDKLFVTIVLSRHPGVHSSHGDSLCLADVISVFIRVHTVSMMTIT